MIRRFSSYVLKKSPLHDIQTVLKPSYGKFGDYTLPLTYRINKSKDTVCGIRKGVGVFDISHMGIINITLNNNNKQTFSNTDKHNFINHILKKIFPIDTHQLKINKSQLTVLLNNRGIVKDDLVISNIDNMKYRLVVNAATKSKIRDKLYTHIRELYTEYPEIIRGNNVNISMPHNIILAIQGPRSSELLNKLFNINFDNIYFNDNINLTMLNPSTHTHTNVEISRCGYTGEDGFEIYCDSEFGRYLYNLILSIRKEYDILFGGLIERDIMRLEAGLCLSGVDFGDDMNIHFNDLGMNFLITKKVKEKGVFIGSNRIKKSPSHKRMGFITSKPVHARDIIYYKDLPIGCITSSNVSYTTNKFISMGYVKVEYKDHEIYCKSRDRNIDLETTPLPFVKHNFYRK